ncbi:MAG: DUF6169 family protein [Spirosomataceae bacterium]
MQKEEHQLLLYDFIFTGGENNIYVFETDKGIVYNVKFKPTDYFFPAGSLYNKHTFEFIIEVVINPSGRNPPQDKLTPSTISAIFEDFYRRNDRTITIYICDSSDSRQEARMKKFTIWYDAFNFDSRYFKIDIKLKDKVGIVYPISILLRTDNPHRLEIIEQFDKVISGYNK